MIIKVPMARFQGVAYNWIKATGTLRLDPDSLLNANTFRSYAPLNNKVMELRKVSFSSHRQRVCCQVHRAPKLSSVREQLFRSHSAFPSLPVLLRYPADGSAER